MTSFNHPVRRRTIESYRVLYSKPSQIVVRLAPGDVLQFRESGRRRVWTLAVDDAFRYAVRAQALA
jgi:hypothetical protein